MNKKHSSYLRGFRSFERSFNLRVLADDKENEAAYEQARVRGRLPFNRSKVLILGDHGVGKTSTCRRLQGKDFRQEEPSTIGIETNTVKAIVSDVNGKWREVANTPREDFESSAACWAVSHVRKRLVNEPTNPSGSTSVHPERLPPVEDIKLTDHALYQAKQSSPLMIMFLLGGFTYGFGLVVWMNILCLMYILDVHTAYRFGCGYTIALVLIDSAMATIDLGSTELIKASIVMTLCILIGLLVGVLMGAGGRTGVCMAFCIMIHPKQKTFTIDNVTEELLVIYSKVYYNLIIYIIAVISVVMFRYVSSKILSMSRKNCVLSLLSIISFIIVAAFIKGRYFVILFYTFSCIVVLGSCIVAGVLSGRKFAAYGYIPKVYIIKKAIGFVAGIFIAILCGWEFVDLKTLSLNNNRYFSFPRYFFSLLLFIVPITAFIVYEWFAYMKVKNTTSIPIKHIKKSMEAGIRNEPGPYLDARLSLWDFAGETIYYNTHHLFMPKQGVYLIVFNAVEAAMNPRKQIKRLQFWLQSVAMHGDIKDVVVFLVGTRRDSVVDGNALKRFTQLAEAQLYNSYPRLLAFYPLSKPSLFFFIENSLHLDQDRDMLQKVIQKEITKLEYFQEEFPVKYLLFHETLNKFRQQKYIITSLEELLKEVNSASNIISQNELCEFLNFFDRSGDVIYNERDLALRKYVICDPQMLIDILTILVNVPKPHLRNRTVAELWIKLQDTGIVDSRLLEHICKQKNILQKHYSYIIHFLVATHLLFPHKVLDPVEQTGTFFLSCRLPKNNSLSTTQISNVRSQYIFYFDFGEILQEFIFLRLIAKCCEMFCSDEIFYDAARFRTDKSCIFFISTEVISGNINSNDRNLIKVDVISEDKTRAMFVLQKMVMFVEEIINQDFNVDYFRKMYTYGPVCERCSSLDGKMCLVNLITDGKDISTLDVYEADIYHTVTLKQKLSIKCSRIIDNQI
ncbi:uncharacterized protein LOC117103740 [Anneissia japonica]|uniref:uncharacterized protein LOC117103740 n=1 Tax=Anneissia japonica TaxID=1529436 RepID=UPI001425AE7B|nr:uncharacterized protein LOC117103740 [Anneissia japonica]